jgi:hypothetical protein
MGAITGHLLPNVPLGNNVSATKKDAVQGIVDAPFIMDKETISNIDDTLEFQKSLSLAYQLMKAIARENGVEEVHNKKENNTNALNDFTVSFENKSNQVMSFTQTSENSNTQSQFTVGLQFSQTENFEFSVIDSGSNTELNISITRQSQFSFSASTESASTQKSDPLILNLNDSDFSFEPTLSVSFDLNADGQLDKISHLNSGNSFLAFDKNLNGIIDDGSELFGDTTGASDGFADLSRYDDNHDGQIDAQDKIFENLLLLNFDSQGNQSVSTLSDENIKSLSLTSQTKDRVYAGDNQLVLESSFKRNDDSMGRMGDFLLSFS